MYWKSGKIAKENIKATGKKKFQYFKFERAPSQNIKTRTSGVAVFSKTFYLLRQ